MKNRLLKFGLSALLIAAVAVWLLPVPPADAAAQVLCRPHPASGRPGPARVTAASGTAYNLDNRGCAVIAAADTAHFLNQGYLPGPLLESLAQSGLTAASSPSPFEFNLPAGTFIQHIIVNNTTANAVTGGIKFGTTAGATDVVSALTCGASCLTFVADSALAKRVFSSTASQKIFVNAVTSLNNASLDITIVYGRF